ncbi:nicotinate-nucleotide--dimethylbenzimidazole phosphoribosyltransferase [Lentisphaerota bacterium WC36G]|nr:nicotinate-nucleotide--dimethylbenzimidazole phosphoribosyltransferase [Lentisphaerae bacterium WC36]
MQLLESTIKKITPQYYEVREQAKQHIKNLTMPTWALGKILDLAVDLAGISGKIKNQYQRKNIILMAGDHGVYEEGVSLQPQEVTAQMVQNFVVGGAGVNALANNANCDVTVVDVGVKTNIEHLYGTTKLRQNKVLNYKIQQGTNNFTKTTAMTQEDAIKAIEVGIEIVDKLADSYDVFGTGEMGIGNTTPSSAIIAALSEVDNIADVVDRGAGLPIDKLYLKVSAIERALKLHQPNIKDPIDVLSKIGGFEIGGIAGIILGAAANRKVVVVDGFISTAGALIAQALCPECVEYMILAHGSVEKGHKYMTEKLGKTPLLDLNLRLGEGSGAALAMNLIDAAERIMNDMATFDSANVCADGIEK